jgi:phosphate uptake regulator
MNRKLVQHGSSSLTVTLPNKWVKRHGLKKGDEVDVEEDSSSLIINYGEEKKGNEIEVTIPTAAEFLKRIFVVPYIHGYDIIKINFNDYNVFDLIQKNAQLLIGFEIVEQGKNYCVLKNVAKGIEEEFETLHNRLFLLTIDMGKMLLDSILKKDFTHLNEIVYSEIMVNKLTDYCRRMLNKRSHSKIKNTNSFYSITCRVEDISDFYRNIGKILLSEISNKKQVVIDKDVVDFFKRIIENVDVIYALFKKFKREDLIKFGKNEKLMYEEGVNLLKEKKGIQSVILHNLLSISLKLRSISEELC